MARGGKRKGAGRPQGALTERTREVAERAAQEGLTPLEFMLQIMRDETQEMPFRADMAKAAAPYIHPRLANVEHKGEGGGPIKIEIVKFDPASQ